MIIFQIGFKTARYGLAFTPHSLVYYNSKACMVIHYLRALEIISRLKSCQVISDLL